MQTEVLLKQLQKCFKLATEQYTIFIVEIQKSELYIESVQNLFEQYSSCESINFDTSPLGKFQDLQRHLTFKIMAQLEDNLKQLHLILSNIEDICAKVQKQNLLSTNSYHKYQKHIPFHQIIDIEPTRPSIALMLEWSEDVTHHFHIEFCKRKFLLESVDYNNSRSVDGLVENWGSFSPLTRTVEDIFPRVSFFIDEKI